MHGRRLQHYKVDTLTVMPCYPWLTLIVILFAIGLVEVASADWTYAWKVLLVLFDFAYEGILCTLHCY